MEFSPNKLKYDLPKRNKAPDSGLTEAQMNMLDMFILLPFMKCHDIWIMITDEKRSLTAAKNASKAFLTCYDSQI